MSEWQPIETAPRNRKGFNYSSRLYKHSAFNDNGCLVWIKSNRFGYGRIVIGSRTDGTRKNISTHRLSYLTFIGEIPPGMCVCHKCDNPSCINPYHLFLGTYKENTHDMLKKGRMAPQNGSNNPRAIINETIAANIKYYINQKMKRRYILNITGVSLNIYKEIKKNRRWVNIKPEPPK